MPFSVLTKGGFVAMLRTGLSRSRWKNWPTPARSAVFPSPETSHATPRRGAKLFRSWFISDRFGPSAPPLAPACLHQFVPGGCSSPLHGSAPSAGLNNSGTKLVSLLSVVYGLKNIEYRTP